MLAAGHKMGQAQAQQQMQAQAQQQAAVEQAKQEGAAQAQLLHRQKIPLPSCRNWQISTNQVF